MLRIFVSAVLLAVLPLAAGAQTRHEHHRHSTTAKSAEKPAPAATPGTSAPATGSASPSASASMFARYQRFTPDEPLKNWREVNDTVRAIGGWQVYGLEAARAIEAEMKQNEKAKGNTP
jgi:hypothetical protein